MGAVALWVAAGSQGSSGPVGHMNSESFSVDQTLPAGTELVFDDPAGVFSFAYSAPYEMSRIEDGFSETLLVQHERKGVQVYMTDFVNAGVLNAARVKREVGGNLNNLQDIQMPGGFPAVTFSTKNAEGDVWDVWFVYDQTLYQITADPRQDKILKKMLETWQFEE